MGEAKRRGPRAPGEADRLPDFMFGRDFAAEEAGGFILAGKLITDIPLGKEPSEGEIAEIAEIIQQVMRAVKSAPELNEAGLWRDGAKPTNGLAPPFPDAAVQARVKHSVVVGVRIDPRNDGRLRLSDYDMADIMGRH